MSITEKELIFFFNKCGINIEKVETLDGMIIERDMLLNNELYEKIMDDIKNLKQYFNSSYLTCLHSNAKERQKWPLLNLVRQILKSVSFSMQPKRISKGYDSEGKKIFKRVFIIQKLKQCN
jgi:hypothetical protein